ncbi:hypothetical protein HKD37_15G043984 [Glycine soja]
MVTPFPIPVTAAQVGTYFIGQYYQVLQSQPEFMHQFYSDASTMLRIDGNARETAAAMLDVGVCYAFVEFENMIGVHNAVKFFNYPYHKFFFKGWFISSTTTSCFPIRNTKRSLPPKAKNLVVVGDLRAFVFGAYYYTMNGYKIFSYQKEQVKERL